MDVYLTSTVGTCDQFMPKKEVSVIISPLRIETDESGSLKVITGCNLWRACKNAGCYYSESGRKGAKI